MCLVGDYLTERMILLVEKVKGSRVEAERALDKEEEMGREYIT